MHIAHEVTRGALSMYFVDQQQINKRLQQVEGLVEATSQLVNNWDDSMLMHLAQERILHLAIEIVTDVGSLLIDGFIMRDASSYEDIIEVISQEGVLDPVLCQQVQQLVQLRRPLVQRYMEWERTGIHPQLADLLQLLPSFERSVVQYVKSELV